MHLRHFVVPTIWMIVILILYGIPGKDLQMSDIWDLLSLDKAAHAFVFMVNTHLWATGFRKQVKWGRLRVKALSIALILSIISGTVLELIQGTIFVGRTTEMLDLIANILGAFLGLLMFRLVYGYELTVRK